LKLNGYFEWSPHQTRPKHSACPSAEHGADGGQAPRQRRSHRACKASDWDGIYVGGRKGKDLVRLSDLEPLLGADVRPMANWRS
jgi:hypothetical protein